MILRRLALAALGVACLSPAAAQQASDPAAFLAQARAALDRGDGVAGEAAVDRALQAGAESAGTHALMAEALLLQGSPARAIDEAEDADDADAAAARIRGRALLQLDRTADAQEAFDAAIRIAPQDPLGWVELGRFQLALGDVAAAIHSGAEAAKRGPRSAPAMLFNAELVRTQYGLAAAIPWFDKAVALAPRNLDALLGRAATLGDLGATRAMLADTRAALAIRKNEPRALYLLAVLAARASMFDLARTLLARAGGKLDDQGGAMLLHAAIEYRSDNDEAAIDWLRRLIAGQPGNLKARRLLGAALVRKRDAAEAVQVLRPLAGGWVTDSYALLLLARASDMLGRAADAVHYRVLAARPDAASGYGAPVGGDELVSLRNAAGDDPRNADARLELVEALIRNRLFDQAVAQAADLTRVYPGAPQAWLLLGDALVAGGRTADAVESYRRAAGIAFTEPTALRMIDGYLRIGNVAQARRVLSLYLDQNPQSVPAALMLANLQMAAREWGDAADTLDDLRLRLGNGDALLLNNLAWSRWQAGDAAGALAAARRASADAPFLPAVMQSYGWMLVRSGRDRAAGVALLETAAAAAPDSPTARWNLARGYAVAARRADARTTAAAALALPGLADRRAAWALLKE